MPSGNTNKYLPATGITIKTYTGLRKWILIVAGTFFTGLGILGIFLPLLPTTVFLLLAAFCYARSSGKFYLWLMRNKLFGSYLKNYREKKGITIKSKIFTISLLWLTILYSAIFMIGNAAVQLLLILIASAVTIHIVTIKTLKK